MTTPARREIAVVTTGRSDYGLLKPVIDALRARRSVRVRILATGMHVSARLGWTIDDIARDGLARLTEPIEVLVDADTPSAVAKSIGLATISFAQVFARSRPDMIVVLGDRVEALGAVTAAMPFNIPVAHIHGGESTEGAIDECVRHAITKMSHLHFASTPRYGARLRQMGEERWRVVVSGAPGLDNIRALDATPAPALARRLGIAIGRETLLVTYHPETLRPADAGRDVDQLLRALARSGRPIVFTAPNADTARDVAGRIARFAAQSPQRVFASNLGQVDYLSLMKIVGAMVGNSSSGLIEAPSFGLPVVNIGDRQRGRIRARNVIDTPPRAGAIERALSRALAPAFRASLRGMRNPYGSGDAAARIAQTLAAVVLDRRLIAKRFVDA